MTTEERIRAAVLEERRACAEVARAWAEDADRVVESNPGEGADNIRLEYVARRALALKIHDEIMARGG